MRAGIALAILIGATCTAMAGSNGPYIVIPGRPGVPIIINGVDASYSVVEGDWGLGKGIHVQPTVYGGRPVLEPPVGHYYPSSGREPGYGRLEIEPAGKPRPAESFHESTSAQSTPQPPQPAVPLYPPAVITAPPYGGAGIQQNFGDPPRDFRDRTPLKPRQ
ncbi:hypothetical protein [Bradyrhizobium sp.]|uniref:hypothetical protein n=1 Tax=Bradyrhizobium sp. TaxID=376 RepID=UPI003C76C731